MVYVWEFVPLLVLFSQKRARVPMSARQSVHDMPVIAGSMELARPGVNLISFLFD